MSVISVNGVKFAVGLDWLPKGNFVKTILEARKGGSTWFVDYEGRTGFAGEGSEYEEGMPVLAAALREVIPEDVWMAVIQADDGRCALVQVRDGVILANGDRLLASADEARQALAQIDVSGWAVYSSARVIPGAQLLEAPGLGGRAGLKRVPFSGVTRATAVRVAVLAGTLGSLAGVWGFRVELLELVLGPPVKTEAVVEGAEPQISAVIDSGALVAGCREAMRRHTPGIPGWVRSGLSCSARFGDAALLALRPALQGRPVLVVRWRMRPGGEESVLRQVAERQLAEWKVSRFQGELEGSVVGRDAWIAVLLPAVVVEASGMVVPGAKALRAKLDRSFGLRAGTLEHGEKSGVIRIVIKEPLSRIAALVEGVPGFEVTKLSRGGSGWVIVGRRARPVTMRETGFAALRRLIQ